MRSLAAAAEGLIGSIISEPVYAPIGMIAGIFGDGKPRRVQAFVRPPSRGSDENMGLGNVLRRSGMTYRSLPADSRRSGATQGEE